MLAYTRYMLEVPCSVRAPPQAKKGVLGDDVVKWTRSVIPGYSAALLKRCFMYYNSFTLTFHNRWQN